MLLDEILEVALLIDHGHGIVIITHDIVRSHLVHTEQCVRVTP